MSETLVIELFVAEAIRFDNKLAAPVALDSIHEIQISDLDDKQPDATVWETS
jgi:hypothetical protein